MAGKEKLFMEACKKKFKEEPTDMSTKYYCYGGWKQSKSKVEFQNTAMEIRALTYKGIQVMCVFTGKDDDLPAAHTIYGRNFARIRSLDQFADTVGALIQNQIRSL